MGRVRLPSRPAASCLITFEEGKGSIVEIVENSVFNLKVLLKVCAAHYNPTTYSSQCD